VTAFPVAQALVHVGTLEREIGASLERIWENVLDWEHLPHLHAGSFASIEKLTLNEGSWRARATTRRKPAEPIVIEVRTEREALRYVSRTLEGEGAGGEIWTALDPTSAHRTRIRVEFWLPNVPAAQANVIGAGFIDLYHRLWDEDETMMRERETRLREHAKRRDQTLPAKHPLGSLSELHRRLPMTVDTPRGRQRIVEANGELIAHSAICPHLLGPLTEEVDAVTAPDADGPPACQVRCPWHGYRFDIRSGRSVDGRSLRLPPAPRLEIDPERNLAWIVWGD
jgi:nitrite reductase/ring-hydroxylating ferredoxin subunit